MIFHKGAYEKTQLFYKINNKSSRKHFIEQIKLEIDTELNDFKITVTHITKKTYYHYLILFTKKVIFILILWLKILYATQMQKLTNMFS
jgi:hypothetical protein